MAGGIGGMGLLFVVAVAIMGGGDSAMEVMDVLQDMNSTTSYQQEGGQAPQFEGADEYEVFASTVLGSNNAMWEQVFDQGGRDYRAPKLVLFREATQSGCGGARSAIGPHYCPVDETMYLDETFFDELQKRFGAKGGDVAEAYVISHEVGHHIQTVLGISDQVRAAQNKNPKSANGLSIKQELQADCFAGMWVHSIKNQGVLGRNEVYEAIDAAEAVGDDRIQEAVNGRVHPESWTHGSSADRKKWFNIGYEYGNFNRCNTFE